MSTDLFSKVFTNEQSGEIPRLQENTIEFEFQGNNRKAYILGHK